MTFKPHTGERREPSAPEALAQELRRNERLVGLQGSLAAGALAWTVLLTMRPAVLAQSPGVNLASLAARLSVLEAHASDLGPKGPAGDAGTAGRVGNKGPHGDAGTNGKDGVSGTDGKDGPQGQAGAGYTPTNLAILGTLSLSGTDLTLSGVNVHVVDGTGSTAGTSGLGNVIVGYNGPSSLFHQARAGSHNLIVGDANNYSSYGGVVGGDENAVGGPYASVLGGTQNLANGPQSSISGGYNNRASGNCAAVSGGYGNKGQGFYAAVSGGNQNTAAAEGSAVSSGNFNMASGVYSSVSGGLSDSVSGSCSAISGGPNLSESYSYGWKGGNVDGPGHTLQPTHGTFGSDKG